MIFAQTPSRLSRGKIAAHFSGSCSGYLTSFNDTGPRARGLSSGLGRYAMWLASASCNIASHNNRNSESWIRLSLIRSSSMATATNCAVSLSPPSARVFWHSSRVTRTSCIISSEPATACLPLNRACQTDEEGDRTSVLINPPPRQKVQRSPAGKIDFVATQFCDIASSRQASCRRALDRPRCARAPRDIGSLTQP
jgi:hypothetical protein